MKATYQELQTYLALRDRLHVVTSRRNSLGELQQVRVARKYMTGGAFDIQIGPDFYSVYPEDARPVYGIAVVLAPAWRTEVNLAGLTSTVPTTPAK